MASRSRCTPSATVPCGGCSTATPARGEANGPRDARHRIEHIELIDRADLPRLGALGVVASIQPPHSPGAMDFPLHPTVEIIGRDRWADAYPWRTLAEAGAPLVFASDWPVADVSVLRGIKAAATRRPWGGRPAGRADRG